MSFQEIMAMLPTLTSAERKEVISRLAELDEIASDQTALARARELGDGSVQPKTQAKVFRNARKTL